MKEALKMLTGGLVTNSGRWEVEECDQESVMLVSDSHGRRRRLIIWWDTQDPNNPGLAFRKMWYDTDNRISLEDSGQIDITSPEQLVEVVKNLCDL